MALASLSLWLGLCGLCLGLAEAQYPASAVEQVEILGYWEFNGFLFEGQYYPRPNPKLQVVFRFEPDGQQSLKYSRQGEPGFCERRGRFAIQQDLLRMQTTWLNPENAEACSRDPDMVLGRETLNHLVWHKHEKREELEADLGIEMELNNKPLIYLLKRIKHPFPSGKKSQLKSRP